jgi:hypothetical protein
MNVSLWLLACVLFPVATRPSTVLITRAVEDDCIFSCAASTEAVATSGNWYYSAEEEQPGLAKVFCETCKPCEALLTLIYTGPGASNFVATNGNPVLSGAGWMSGSFSTGCDATTLGGIVGDSTSGGQAAVDLYCTCQQ